MNILFSIHQFYPWHTSGTERVVITTAKYLKLLGHRVAVVTYSFRDRDYYDQTHGDIAWKIDHFEGIEVFNIRYHIDEWAELNAAIYQPRMLPFFEMLLTSHRPDVVHIAHAMRTGTIAWAAKKLQIPYVLGLTDFWMICHKAIMVRDDQTLCSGNQGGLACRESCLGLRKEYYTDRFGEASELHKNAASVIVSSHWLHQTMAASLGDLGLYQEVPYGVERGYLGFNLRRHKNVDRLIFGFIGTLSAHKGVEVLLSSVKEIPNEAIEIHVWGDGPLRERVIEASQASPLVKYMGVYDKQRTKEVLGTIDVGLVPSTWYENNPIILQEMLASNVPVIVSATGGLTELVIDGVNGWHFPVGDVVALSERIRLLGRHPEVLDELKVASESRIVTVEQQGLQYLAIYSEAARSRQTAEK